MVVNKHLEPPERVTLFLATTQTCMHLHKGTTDMALQAKFESLNRHIITGSQ